MDKENKVISSGNETIRGFMVEARCPHSLVALADKAYGNEWKHISFEKGVSIGVPSGPKKLNDHSLLSWNAANALRWWFVASLGADAFKFETRIMEYVLSTSYSVTEVKGHSVENHLFSIPRDKT